MKEKEMENIVEGLELDEEEALEQIKEALGDFDVQAFLVDVLLFDYLIKNGGAVTVTEEDMKKVDEMRKTRSIEFMSDSNEDGERVMVVRLIYEGKEKVEDEKVSNDN